MTGQLCVDRDFRAMLQAFLHTSTSFWQVKIEWLLDHIPAVLVPVVLRTISWRKVRIDLASKLGHRSSAAS